jgi:Aph-1 protein
MTAAALAWGSAFLAFGPVASILFLIVYKKAQLVIVVTTSAFAFLLSALGASLVWFIFDAAGVNHPIIVLLPGVIFQGIMRCGFVALYHKVEKVIEGSIARHEQHQIQRGETEEAMAEAARLRLELNDWACGLAAGVGFGGMHAVLLYGTLLASESGNLGTLIQDSCPSMPGLILSALNAFFFTILDMIWMLFTFFGMRRRRSSGIDCSRGWGAMLGNSTASGNMALAICGVTHLAASFATTPNAFGGGCRVSIPLLAGIVVMTAGAFIAGVSKIYLPANQRRRMVVGANHD